MGLGTTKWEKPGGIVIPGKYQQSPRLAVWYKHGYSQAQRGFTPSDNWLRRLDEDKAVSEAYRDGHRAGERFRD